MKPEQIKKWNDIQHYLGKGISLHNIVHYPNDIKYVAGVDLAYWQQNHAVCCICVMDYPSKTVIETITHTGRVNVPYVPGYLSFRELPLVMETVGKLKTVPDIYLFDGNGYLHERHMGLATQASFYLHTPTIGVAKSYYRVANHDLVIPENTTNAYTDIVIHGDVYGRVLRTRENVKPIFISCGNWIDLTTTTKIVSHFIEKESRLPMPIRFADLATRKAKREYANGYPNNKSSF